MKQKFRIYYTDNQKALMWERWRQGDSLQKIAQLFDRNPKPLVSHADSGRNRWDMSSTTKSFTPGVNAG
jgi:hypothetical protein